MSKAVIKKKIKEVVKKIVREYKPEKIILFGSYARGEPHQWSDLDLFIVKESKKKRREREYELRLKLFGNKFPPLDLQIYTPDEVKMRVEKYQDFFVQEILKAGKVLYAK